MVNHSGGSLKLITMLIGIFVLGLTAGIVLGELAPALQREASEKPSAPILVEGADLAAPQDRIPESRIWITEDQAIIRMQGLQWAAFAPTGSMLPTFGAGHHALQIIPTTPEDIQPGDIISFETTRGVIIHRVQAVGHDKRGWYALTQGDNAGADPEKLRWRQVKKVLVAIIY